MEVNSVENRIQLVDIDSKFFDKKIAKISCHDLDIETISSIDSWCIKNSIVCLYLFVDIHALPNVKLIEKKGYFLVDVRLNYFKNLQRSQYGSHQSYRDDIKIIKLDKGDVKNLEFIKIHGSKLFVHSRYYTDGNFELKKLEEFHSRWIENIHASESGLILVAIKNNELIVGFLAGEFSDASSAKVTLIGSFEKQKGIGSVLLESFEHECMNRGCNLIKVTTQAKNSAAIALYEKHGYKINKVDLCFHKWFF